MDEPYDPQKSCVAFQVRRLSRIVTRRYEDALRPVKLKSFQFTALVALSARRSIAQTKLADAFGMDISTLSRNLKPLEARGVIEILSDANDRRVRLVRITAAGHSLVEQAMPLWKKAQADTLGRLGADKWRSMSADINSLIGKG